MSIVSSNGSEQFVSKTKIYEFLNSEFQKNPRLQEGVGIVNKASHKSDPEHSRIYEFKLEKTTADTVFAHENSGAGAIRVGTLIGSRSEQYMQTLQRYQVSRSLALTASEYERNWIRNFTNCLLKKVWRYKANYALKGALAGIFLLNWCKAEEANKLNNLKTGKQGCDYDLYKSTMFSFALLAGSIVLI